MAKATTKKESKTAKVTEEKTEVKEAKVEKQTKHGKKYTEASESVDRGRQYSVKEAVEMAQKTSYSKFPGTIELHINTSAKNMRGLTSMPYSIGRKLTILAFGKGADESGADIVGTEETVEEINKGKINFDVVVTTPDWMPKLAKIARILGPRGLMPNPKSGTIAENLSKAVADLQAGKVEYKTEPNGQVIHLPVGKATQAAEEIVANIKALYNTIGRSRIKKVTVAPTMGPGIKVELSSI
jgi:large subunit ribosomal protein L1